MNETQEQILRYQANFRGLQDLALRHNGVVVSRMSQAVSPIKDLIATDPVTKNGICQALTNKWIADHANGGSMWNDLCSNVAGQVCFDIGKLKQLMGEFKWGVGGANEQKLRAEIYLDQHGVRRRSDIVSGDRVYSENMTSLAPDPSLGIKIGRAISVAGNMNSGGSYRMISIKAAGAGHVFAAYVGGASTSSPESDVAFYDSNFGEFWFERAIDFRHWYRVLWSRTYARTFGGFQIRDFAKSAAHARGLVQRGMV